MKLTLLTGLMCLTAAVFAADVNLNDAKIWGKTVTSPAAGVLEFNGPEQYMPSAARFKIDPTKTYRFSGEVRKAPGAKSHLFLAGFFMYDKDQRGIHTNYITVIKGTTTELISDAKVGATTIKVKNAVRWPKSASVGFNAGKLPNRELAPYKSVKKEGTTWIITLHSPLKKAYKAGGKVWVQAGGAYLYTSVVRQPKDGWVKFSGTVKGIAPANVEKGQFWPGSVYAAPMLMPNWNFGPGHKDFKTQVRNLKLEVVK